MAKKKSMYPDDEDGAALQRIADDGSDMSAPMEIDFFVFVPDEDTGNQVADAAEAKGYVVELSVDEDDPDGEWICKCQKTMTPDYDAIMKTTAELNELSKPFGGEVDGWGTFGNAPEAEGEEAAE